MTKSANLEWAAQAPPLSNAEIADRLESLAQLLATEKRNHYKVRAYRRAAATIRTLADSLDELVHSDSDLTMFSGIGNAIAGTIREIVLTGRLKSLEKLRSDLNPQLADISRHPRLDPKRVLLIYKKLGIHSLEELERSLSAGAIGERLGARIEQHVRQALVTSEVILLYHAHPLKDALEEFLLNRCGVRRVEVAGDLRRRREVIDEIAFLIETQDFDGVIARTQRYGGRAPLVESDSSHAIFALPSGVLLRLQRATRDDWGLRLVELTGSREHLATLKTVCPRWPELGAAPLPAENDVYRALGVQFIPPELREGRDEVARAAAGTLPELVEVSDLRGELHAHSTSSDGVHSIEEMAQAARERGYEYIGITDHSQSLKIARGLPEAELWEQIRFIDRLNERFNGIRILKSSEVDILADGTLDYPDALLRELDYTVCSIHSRFALGRTEQTERILRAMDNRHFHILGHATGRLLLRRPGYEVDIEHIIERASKNGCFFEINSSPDRLDLSADNARLAAAAGIRIAVNTDAHSTRDFRLTQGGIDQARRAGLRRQDVLNTLPLPELLRAFNR